MRRFGTLLGAVILLALVPAPAFAKAATASFSSDARPMLNAYAALVEQHLSSVLTGLAAVASTEEAASGQWDRIEGPLSEVGRRAPAIAAAWFVRPDGSYFTVDQGLTDQNLSDRTYFPGLMAGSDVFGEVVISKSTGKRSAVVAVPVRAEGRVVGAVGASVDLEKLAAAVDEAMALPSDMIFYALDSQGRTTLHRDTAKIFEFPSDLGTKSLRSAVDRMLRSPRGSVTYRFNGAPRTVLFKHADATNWVFVLGKIGRQT
jgi:C4-dicarboxylate-specific signal transduction histidine kinase